MTDDPTDDATAVHDLALSTLGLPDTWAEPAGYRDSLALSAIDSVFSLRSSYAAVVNILDRYRALRRADGADPYQDSGADLLAVIERAGGDAAAADTIFTRNFAPGTKVLKVTALARGVAGLGRLGIATAADLRDASPSRLAAARTTWLATPGLGVASWDYLEMNVGLQGVKADTMIRRFVTRAVGAAQTVGVARAREAVKAAAALLRVSPKTLDHRIWRVESGRD